MEQVAASLAARGYRTYVDPDGSDYFDLAVVRGEEVGLVEGKVGTGRRVLGQALRRRAWADWVAVAVDSPRIAERLVAATRSGRSAVVGVWSVDSAGVNELRPPTVRPPGPATDAYAPLRARLRAALDSIDRGETPSGVGWGNVVADVRRASGGRGFAEWRLDELDDEGA